MKKTLLIILGVLITLIIVAGLAWYIVKCNNKNSSEDIACTMEVKQCSDGSYVGRIAPTCEFAECSNSTADWETYINKEQDFEFKYPKSMTVIEDKYNNEFSMDFSEIFLNNPNFSLSLYVNDPGRGYEGFEDYKPAIVTKIDGKEGKIRYLHMDPDMGPNVDLIVVQWNNQQDKYFLGLSFKPDNRQEMEIFINQILSTFKFVDNEKYCEEDENCSCGGNVTTGECFIGNKSYVTNITQLCPDFCAGFSGNSKIKCVNNECQ